MDLDIIIPTYNRAHLLKDCLRSIFVAARPKGLNITVVAVDNNSGDNTREIVQSFLELREKLHQAIETARLRLESRAGENNGEEPGL